MNYLAKYKYNKIFKKIKKSIIKTIEKAIINTSKMENV